jgi:hypothetical protein
MIKYDYKKVDHLTVLKAKRILKAMSVGETIFLPFFNEE